MWPAQDFSAASRQPDTRSSAARYDGPMYATEAPRLRPMPHWRRVCLNSFLILGIFAIHNVLTGDDGAMAALHETTAMAATAGDMQTTAGLSHATTAHPQLVAAGDGSGMSMSDCGGLMMLCIAMIGGIGAFIVLRKAAHDRVLWQLPPPHIFALGSVLTPLHNLSPLQRTAVLRR